MDLHRIRRSPAGVARRWRERRNDRAVRGLRTRLRVDPTAAPVLLSPHWDDAVLSCWDLLSAPSALTVVNVFAGIPESGGVTRWDAITGAAESTARVRERIAEDTEALGLAGRTPIQLPLLGASYRERSPKPSPDDIDRALADVIDATSRVYAPARLGPNDDHGLVRNYARALLYSGVPVSLYADVPYCVAFGWPHWVDGGEPDPHRNVDAFWRSELVYMPELSDLRSGRVVRLSDERASAKLEAMRTYRTQFPSLDGGVAKLLSNPATHRFEVVWEL